MILDEGASKLNCVMLEGMWKTKFSLDFQDGAFYGKNGPQENFPMIKNIDLTLNAMALIPIEDIKVNVILWAFNCYLAQTSSTLH